MIPDSFSRAVRVPLDKGALRASPVTLDAANLDRLGPGRFDWVTPQVTLACHLQEGPARRLFVLLSSAGRTDQAISFQRVSWAGRLNGDTLNIEDPMYARHAGLSGGWYYGNDERSDLDAAADLVARVAARRGIAVEDVICLGSSAGGHAAIGLAARLPGATAFAMNPQIRVRDHGGGPSLRRIAGVDLDRPDPLGRNCLRHVAGHPRSRFIILCNRASDEDYAVQIGPWLAELPLAPPFRPERGAGILRHGACTFVLYDAPSDSPHHVFPDIDEVAMLLPLLLHRPAGAPGGIDADAAVNDILAGFVARNALREENRRISYWTGLVQAGDLTRLGTVETNWATYLRLRPHGLPRGWFFRLTPNRRLDAVTLRLSLSDLADADRPRLRTALDTLGGGRIIESPDWLSLELGSLPLAEAPERLPALLDRTLAGLRGIAETTHRAPAGAG